MSYGIILGTSGVPWGLTAGMLTLSLEKEPWEVQVPLLPGLPQDPFLSCMHLETPAKCAARCGGHPLLQEWCLAGNAGATWTLAPVRRVSKAKVAFLSSHKVVSFKI